ncbi:Wall-associated receptor kinase [Heracleum sosnowskyi]|uniref:Wall-associated receptor kinase n=1 Tax=Heracleum sosnowskyi TaxID=360622 RepID=A0AAD8JF30_9APIA|nr:Wall-associated receptor kinase [Heracleum sosnowskyi]
MATQLVLQMMLLFLFLHEASAQESSVAKPGCPRNCGNLTIAYPFGIGADCSANQTFTIFCNNSINPPKAFLDDNFKLEVLNISLKAGTIQVNTPVITNCEKRSNYQQLMLSGSFIFSNTQNQLTAIGCETLAVISQQGLSVGGCMTFCNISSVERNNSCYGSCCQTRIPPSLKFINASLESINGKEGCGFVFVVDQNWFGNMTDVYDVTNMEQVPAVLDWRPSGFCHSFGAGNSTTDRSVCGRNTLCTDQSLCSCREGYEGNPYLLDGCQDIDECATYDFNRCQQICNNFPGSYSCSCIKGWVNDGQYECKKTDPNGYTRYSPSILIVTCTGLGVLLVLAPMWLYKVLKQRKKRKLKEKFFKRNGGLLLNQQVSSSESNVDTTKLFSSKELDKATNHYNVDRILGQGGQGTVYKGMLTDGRIVAVKKSKIEDGSKLDHFINEIIILSQINHRNVVRLHGCCLETEVPLLVYEFIPNGTLFEYIHDHNEDFPLTWDVRVRVATEVAGALSYLHSAASIPVYHRDIKSSNILLDEKYRAKVADFGTSRSICIDQTHVTTKRVQGTFGYFDPEYFRSSQYTDKSDVYSFGVVLVELLTGQKPILAPRPDDEGRSLVTYFISAMEENRILDVTDVRIAKDSVKEELITFAKLAYRCLNLKGRKRPTMKQVAAELESINMSNGSAIDQQHYKDVAYSVTELNEAWDLASTSISSSANYSLTVDVEPLITK